MDIRERYSESPIRIGNVGRGLTVLAALLFVIGWVGAVAAALQLPDGGGGSGYIRLSQLILLGSYVTLAAATLGLLGIAMRVFSIWLDIRVARETL
jgi:hypothetical protein